ncbi:DUF4382 domain-containing protein [Sulfurovum sp. zt1-1]|uniref:DUF4382 domain-containing protein n=1 Tax=Sulfurovum zhangzhouensis TaxID=3019067 RepID=A0ABT7QVT6_9BACT|nr:DUF4382 domain-containing protein [Sulfurovum zhangzhouensis]MDM5270654.1 DUF4382 domain-containing protein [Sulfurovum zhangzhouensis]
MKQLIAALGLTLSLLLSGCGGGSTSTTTGIASMSLTDAPTDDENVKSVFVTFTGLRYQYADSNESWQDVDFNESRTIDLLTLQDGNSTMLNEVELPAGEIAHVRFKLDTSNCYIEFVDGSPTAKLTVPSGDQTGYKAIGGFTIPAGGVVNITADFDVRKSVASTGNGKYMLKPTIKIIDNIEVGEINGTMNIDVNGSQAILYAYTDGSWDDAESNTTGSNFSNAVLSTDATDGTFTLPWLTTGTYDLVLVAYTNTGEFENVLGFIDNVVVEADTTTTVDITDENLLDVLP